jgi:hypothetical protein
MFSNPWTLFDFWHFTATAYDTVRREEAKLMPVAGGPHQIYVKRRIRATKSSGSGQNAALGENSASLRVSCRRAIDRFALIPSGDATTNNQRRVDPIPPTSSRPQSQAA